MTLNTISYDRVHEGIEIISENDFGEEDDPLKQQPEQVDPILTPEEVQDP